MENPWLKVSLKDYEEHMASEGVFQLQTLNRIVKEQLRYRKPYVAILGAAGGNGLEHMGLAGVETVYALDISESFLATCRERYGYLKNRLQTLQCDLRVADYQLPFCNLLLCNLIIEYLGVDAFAGLIQRNARNLEIVSAVIQKSGKNAFIGASETAEKLKTLETLHQDIDEKELTQRLGKAGFLRLLRKTYALPDGKEFVRIDFKNR